jgi:hypothetical protein
MTLSRARTSLRVFFTALIEKNFLQSVGREKGKFRTFLLAALQHYLSDQYDRAKALKRGRGRFFSLNFDEAEAESHIGRASAKRRSALPVGSGPSGSSPAMQALKEEYAAARGSTSSKP